MNDGAKINGNTNTSYTMGGGVYVSIEPSSFTMNGGIISGNTTIHSGGGGVASTGNFIINDGTISKNENKGDYGGGGIFLTYGTLTMYGGIISGNSSDRFGGGVYAYGNNPTFIMHGGIISGNTAKEAGGGVEASYNCTFKKLPSSGEQNSGIIYGSEAVGVDDDGIPLKNTSNYHGDAVYGPSYRYRDTTAERTDQIDTSTNKGLSANGNPPFGQ